MPELIIEELTRSGAHIGYHRVAALPARIGRALDNDIVIADPYVSPVHLVIESGSGAWIVSDQASDNGTFIGKGKRLDGPAELVSGDQLMVGRTVLRLWSPSHQVPPAWRFQKQQSITRRIAIPLFAFVSFLVTLALATFQEFLDTAKQTRLISLFANTLPFVFFPLIWAGIWACAGFIVRRKSNYALQLMAANGALVFILLLTVSVEYIDYFTSSTKAATIVQYAGMALLAVLLLFVNLTISTGAVNLRRTIIAVVIGVGTIAIVAVADHAERFENRISPEYSHSLKPPYAKIAPSITLDQFIKDSERLFKKDK